MFNAMTISYLTKLVKLILIGGLITITDVALLSSNTLSQAQTVQARKTQADKLRDIALQYYDKNQIPQALQTLEKELKLRRQTGDIQQEISALNLIGIMYDQQSKYTQSMESLQLALTKLKKSNLSEDIKYSLETELLIGTSIVYANQGNYRKAIESSRKARLLSANRFRRIGDNGSGSIPEKKPPAPDVRVDAKDLYDIAVTQAKRGKKKEALGTAQAALKMLQTVQDKAGEQVVTRFISTLRQQK
jgi:tetratricopeptide (TPR) repeat protein